MLESRRTLPPSQQYLQQEVENVLEGLHRIDAAARAGEPFKVIPEWIKEQNRLVLQDLDTEDHVVPGEYTEVRAAADSQRVPSYLRPHRRGHDLNHQHSGLLMALRGEG